MSKAIVSIAAALTITLATVACSITVPVVLIASGGTILRGTATASLSGGSFTVTDGVLTCAGSYDPLNADTTISMPTFCSDGRKGIVIATRDRSGQNGHGRIRLNDGSEGDFIFGEAAKNF
jgi:hypothetical protein